MTIAESGALTRRQSLRLLATTAALATLTQPLAAQAPNAGRATPSLPNGGAMHLSPQSPLGDLLAHPAFAGFAQHTLPWDNRTYDAAMPLAAIGSLLPYHSHVDAGIVVGALNRMVDDASSGQTIFFDIYSEAEKQAAPAKRNTGLFFLRGRPGAPFALIAPGGGFAYVGSVHEGFPYAAAINRHGYNALVLRYRVGQGGGVATEDMAAALSFSIRNADRLGVERARYSLWGSSAGARMAVAIGSWGAERFGSDALPKPAAVIMAYTGHSEMARTEPPTFVVVGENDGIAPPRVMEARVQALRAIGTTVSYRKYPNVGHGFGVGAGTSADGWIDDAVRFWTEVGAGR